MDDYISRKLGGVGQGCHPLDAAAGAAEGKRIKMRISVCRHTNQFAFLPSIGILYRLRGEFRVRIAAMWLFWGVSIGIVRNPYNCEALDKQMGAVIKQAWERTYGSLAEQISKNDSPREADEDGR